MSSHETLHGQSGVHCRADWRARQGQISAPAGEGSKSLSDRCGQNSGLGDRSAKPSWNGWGAGIANARFQDAASAQLTPEQVPKDAGLGDFGASPILRTLPNGKTILVAGQKTGIIWAQDPDRKCAFVWETSVASKPGPQGQVDFGGSADGRNAYFGPRRGASSVSHPLRGDTLRPIRTAITTVPASVKAPVAA